MTMTKDELQKRIEDLELANKLLKESKGQTVKSKIVEMIEKGVNCIEDLAETLNITSKNVSSNLTAIRNDMKSERKTIVTQRIEKKTMLCVVNLDDMNW